MFEKVDFLINIINGGGNIFYFYHKARKILLPLEAALNLSSRIRDSHPSQPSTQDTFKKTLFSLKAKIKYIKIYLYQEGNYYTYLSLLKNDSYVDINSSFIDAMELMQTFNIPVLVEKNILQECGFKVTKELIEKALVN